MARMIHLVMSCRFIAVNVLMTNSCAIQCKTNEFNCKTDKFDCKTSNEFNCKWDKFYCKSDELYCKWDKVNCKGDNSIAKKPVSTIILLLSTHMSKLCGTVVCVLSHRNCSMVNRYVASKDWSKINLTLRYILSDT